MDVRVQFPVHNLQNVLFVLHPNISELS